MRDAGATFAVVLLAIAAAIVYGIIHDEITARVCVEYFTIGHRPILGGTHSPTLLGLGWGVLATWWAGAMIGIPLAVVARAGRSRRKIRASELVKPIAIVLIGMGICAIVGGLVDYRRAQQGFLDLNDPLSWEVPAAAQFRYIADAGAHVASYVAGFFGGLLLCGYVAVRRWRSGEPGPP